MDKLVATDAKLASNPEVQKWLAEVNRIMQPTFKSVREALDEAMMFGASVLELD